MIILRGMTWNHPRGYDPLVATSAAFSVLHPDVRIEWAKRSLQDFEQFPVKQLAAEYDLMVIDHPHVGGLADAAILLPLDEAALRDLAENSVGPSFASYRWNDRQWAVPIDAAAQVQAWRQDLLDAPASRWRDVLDLAKQGKVICPLRAPHQLMSFMTLAANAGTTCCTGSGLLAAPAAVETLERLRELAALIPPTCRTLDPIGALELLASRDDWALAPLVYGYVSYAQDGFRERLVRFADIPAVGNNGPVGSVIGGTGLAISSRCAHPDVALAYALFAASGPIQKGLYAASGGQPGHRAAWLDMQINDAAHGFYRDTLATLDSVWLRPRHEGYVGFQAQGSALIDAFLDGACSARHTADALNSSFEASFSAAGSQ